MTFVLIQLGKVVLIIAAIIAYAVVATWWES